MQPVRREHEQGDQRSIRGVAGYIAATSLKLCFHQKKSKRKEGSTYKTKHIHGSMAYSGEK